MDRNIYFNGADSHHVKVREFFKDTASRIKFFINTTPREYDSSPEPLGIYPLMTTVSDGNHTGIALRRQMRSKNHDDMSDIVPTPHGA